MQRAKPFFIAFRVKHSALSVWPYAFSVITNYSFAPLQPVRSGQPFGISNWDCILQTSLTKVFLKTASVMVEELLK